MYSTIITPTFKLDVNYVKKLLLMLYTLPSGTAIDLGEDGLTEEQQHDYIQALFLQTLTKSGVIDISENSSGNYSINSNIPHLIS